MGIGNVVICRPAGGLKGYSTGMCSVFTLILLTHNIMIVLWNTIVIVWTFHCIFVAYQNINFKIIYLYLSDSKHFKLWSSEVPKKDQGSIA